MPLRKIAGSDSRRILFRAPPRRVAFGGEQRLDVLGHRGAHADLAGELYAVPAARLPARGSGLGPPAHGQSNAVAGA